MSGKFVDNDNDIRKRIQQGRLRIKGLLDFPQWIDDRVAVGDGIGNFLL